MRTSRSTGGTSTPFPATPGTGGATTTRSAAFPYEDLREENGRRGKLDPEYELLDTGVFDDDRYWIVEVHYAKADPHDILMSIQVTNAGPEADDAPRAADARGFATPGRGMSTPPKPELAASGPAAVDVGPSVPRRPGTAGAARNRPGRPPTLLFCDNETNVRPALRRRHRARRTPRTGSTTTWSTARPRSTPSGGARSARCGTS